MLAVFSAIMWVKLCQMSVIATSLSQ